ncbi:hypothetical protein ID866_9830 [Astraeus odoratus]|nr:hypothetical protein ID866_9830 [Astraeus odoratus]
MSCVKPHVMPATNQASYPPTSVSGTDQMLA